MSRTFTYNFTADGHTGDITITTSDQATDQTSDGYDFGYGYDVQEISGTFDGKTIQGEYGSSGVFGTDLFGNPYDNILFTGDQNGIYGSSHGIDAAGIDFLTTDGDDYELDSYSGQFYYSDASNYGTEVGYNHSDPICYCSGTRLQTDRGEAAIEDLAIGDRVWTFDGWLEPIRWIGRRSYAGQFIAGNPRILPVCIKAGALADGVPQRDLWVSPGHALFIDGHLIRAGLLVNGVSIIQAESVGEVTYTHIELDRHAVVLAEGCPAETFRDEVSRNQFGNAAEYRALYSEGCAPMQPYAPKLEDGFHLELIRCRIGLRAGIAARPACEPGPLKGFVDVAGPDRVCGWAADESRPGAPVVVDVLVNGRPVLHLIANRDRPDLRAAGLASTRHAFEVTLPKHVRGCPVEVRRSSDGKTLARTEAAEAKVKAAA